MSNRQYRHGFTLIEVLFFIVFVSGGLAGILLVSNTVVKTSADPLINKQAIAIAESLLEEILLKDFCDPATINRTTTPPTCGANTAAASRTFFDDVNDYNGYSTTGGIVDVLGSAVSGLGSYNVSAVSVVPTTDLTGIAVANARKITVSVTGPGGTVTLTGYRTNY